MIGNGTQLLELVERIAEAAERIADHLTKPRLVSEPGSGTKPKRNYNEHPQPESSNAEAASIRRPKQAGRS